MHNAVAFANNDIATIAWSYGTRPDGCMGFAVYRIDSKGQETALPSHAVFKGDTIQAGQTTDEFPIQKFYWKDPYARLAGEKSGNMTFRYKIVPLEGKPGSLDPMKSLPILTTNEVEITSVCSPSLSAVFNRGIISTQHVADALAGHVDATSLKANISKPGNQLRTDLAGDMIATLTGFLKRAKAADKIYAALYELTDVELIQGLVAVGAKLNIVVADIVAPKPKDGTTAKAGENDAAWNKIHPLCKDTSFYREPPSNHIVHNKFLVYANSKGHRQSWPARPTGPIPASARRPTTRSSSMMLRWQRAISLTGTSSRPTSLRTKKIHHRFRLRRCGRSTEQVKTLGSTRTQDRELKAR